MKTVFSKYLCLFIVVILASQFPSRAQIVRTVAGDGAGTYTGDGGPAVAASFHADGVAVDRAGNFYISDPTNNVIRMVNPAGVIVTFAGRRSSFGTFGGDGGPADSAYLNYPKGLLVDHSGRYLYIADNGNSRIRKIDLTTNIITTVAGTGRYGTSGDGGPATAAAISGGLGLGMDDTGNLYIADGNTRVRKIDTGGIITTFAGSGALGYTGNGGPATRATFQYPTGVAADHNGNIYIADNGNYVIRMVNRSGIITAFAGNGIAGLSGDGGLATLAKIRAPWDVKVDDTNNVYFTDLGNCRVREVNTSNIISTYAGGSCGYTGDGGPPTSAKFSSPYEIYLDAAHNMFIADNGNNRIREIVPAPVLHLFKTTNDTICYGTNVELYTTITGAGYGAPIYKWVINGVNIGLDTSAIYDDTLVGTDTISCSLLDPAGNYVLSSDTMVFTVLPLIYPSIAITKSTDSVCYHTIITYTATPVNGGAGANLEWENFGSPIGVPSDTILNFMANNGDIISCIMICDTPCAIPDTVVSNSFKMFIYPNVRPVATMVVFPLDSVPNTLDTASYTGQVINYYAGIDFGGTNPQFQWYLNNAPVPGATTNFYTKRAYYTDTVYCVVGSNAECAYPPVDTTNITVVYVSHLAVNNVYGGDQAFKMFPVPNNGSFTLTTEQSGYSDRTLAVAITDVLGHTVYSTQEPLSGTGFTGTINTGGRLCNGFYLLHLTTETVDEVIPFEIVK